MYAKLTTRGLANTGALYERATVADCAVRAHCAAGAALPVPVASASAAVERDDSQRRFTGVSSSATVHAQ